MEELIEKFNDVNYIKYIELLNKTDNILIKDGKLYIDKYEIQMPKIVYVKERISEIESEKKAILLKVFLLQQKILNAKNPKLFQNEYNAYIMKIVAYDDEHDMLNRYFQKINEDINTGKKDKAHISYNSSKLYQELQADIHYDGQKVKKLVKHFLDKLENNGKDQEYNMIDYYITELPIIKLKKEAKEPEPKKDIKKLTNIQKNIIKDNIKNLLKFKSKAECVSKAKSKAFYMSKEEIIKLIDSTPELKAIVPENYKTLNKEQLCSYLSNE
jgi:hypothetical protein